MIEYLPSLARVALLGLLVASLASCRGPAPSSREERERTFTWFGTLGFPDVKGRSFVRVATGRWWQPDDGPLQNSYLTGFLLEDRGETFVVFTPALETLTLRKTPDKAPAHERVGYEVRDLAADAAAYLKALRDLETSKKDDPWRRFGERLSERAEVFVLAWACWRHGLDARAAELYDHAAAMTGNQRGRNSGGQPEPLPQAVAGDIAHAEMWRAVLDFGAPGVSRRQLLERFERLVRNYPESEHAARAVETADLLRKMVKEDTEHAAKRQAGKPFEQLSKKEQIAELIFQLRDQNGHQWDQPGACDIFLTRDGKEDTPAHRLVKYGFDAVPQLIDALEDPRFTRSVGFHRDFCFSHFVLRVGDCAEAILVRIAGRSFYERNSTYASMYKDGMAGKVKEGARAWWAEVQKKGEKAVLVEATAKGDRNSPYQGERLLERYPDAALPALTVGAKASRERWVREALVALSGKVKGNACLPFLLAELKDGPFLAGRLAAARGLHERGRPEGVPAMIAEWEGRRPAPGAARPEGAPGEADDGPASVAGFLASCGTVEAIEALGKDLRRRPVDLRETVVKSFAEDETPNLFSTEARGPLPPTDAARRDPPERVRAAIERLLVAALDDTEERVGMGGVWGRKRFSDPRICDMAGHVLNLLAPRRYPFDLEAPLAERDRARVALKNVWRQAHGQAPLPLPARKAVPPVPEEKLQPLLEKRLRGPEAERQATEREIERLGVGALPGVLQRLEGAADPDRAVLERLARRLASLVTEVVIAEESLEPDALLAARLKDMKGRPFDPAAFVHAVTSLVEVWPRRAHAVRFTADRAGDGTGMVLKVDLLDKARAAQLGRSGWTAQDPAAPRDRPYNWEYNERVQVGRKGLRGVSGSGTAVGWEGESAGLRDALTEACAAAPREPIAIRVQLIADWPK
jgi:hypothetical protein